MAKYEKKEKEQDVKIYTIELQKTYLDILLTDSNAFTRCQNILKPEYFNDRLKPAVRFMLEFADQYRALPLPEQIKAETNVDLQQYDGLQPQHVEWCLDEVESFCRHRAVELVSFESADLIPLGKYSEFESKLREALTISLQTDLGTGYWEDPKGRIQAVLDRQDVMSTGWKVLDQKLYGGFTKGTLNIFAGGSGSGKSLFLQNLALNWAYMGMDVIYFSLELSENLVAARIDSMVTGFSTKDIFRKIDDVDLKVKMTQKHRKAGDLRIKKLSEAGTSSNDLRAYMKEYEIQTGKKPTAVIVDYLDLMYPNNKKINPSDMFVKDKFVAEELRAFASEFHLLFATASQLNRCISLDTKIVVNGSEIEIKDVQVGDWLESENGPVRVTEVLPITKQAVFEITTKSGKKIKVSAKHKFPTSNGLKTIENGLVIGDLLRSRTK